MYKYPEKNRYKFIIPTIKGDCILQYEQATAKETIDYLDIFDLLFCDDLGKRVQGLRLLNSYWNSFIDKHYPVKRYQIRKKQIVGLVKKNIDKYMEQLVLSRHKLWKSIYLGTKPPKINGKVVKDYPFDNHLEVISKKTGIPIDQLYDRLTMEQIGWYIDKIVYDNYEQFKEGKAINMKVIGKKGLSDEQKKDLEIIRKNLHSKK